MNGIDLKGRKDIEAIIEWADLNKNNIKNVFRSMTQGEKLSNDEENVLRFSMIAFVLKNLIPSKYYNRIVIEVKDYDEENKGRLGKVKKVKDKYIVTYTTKDFQYTGDIYKILKNLSTIAHELHHVRQYINIENDTLDISTLIGCLERLLCRRSKKYYEEKYDSLYFEVEACLYGNMYAKSYLEKYTDKNINLDSFVEVMTDNIKSKWRIYQSDEYVKKYIKEMLLKINNELLIKFKPLRWGLYPLEHVLDEKGFLYSSEYFEDALNNDNLSNDIIQSNRTYEFYKLLTEISSEIYEKKRCK